MILDRSPTWSSLAALALMAAPSCGGGGGGNPAIDARIAVADARVPIADAGFDPGAVNPPRLWLAANGSESNLKLDTSQPTAF
jgi:hypothetical protein